MRYTLFAVILVTAACANLPTAPTPPPPTPAPVAAAEAMVPIRTIVLRYRCKTQPRLYVLPDGTTQWEIDWYASKTPCPAVPID